MLNHSDILELVLNIENSTLKEEILGTKNINYKAGEEIHTIEIVKGKHFNVGDEVLLKVDLITYRDRSFHIVEVLIQVIR